MVIDKRKTMKRSARMYDILHIQARSIGLSGSCRFKWQVKCLEKFCLICGLYPGLFFYSSRFVQICFNAVSIRSNPFSSMDPGHPKFNRTNPF